MVSLTWLRKHNAQLLRILGVQRDASADDIKRRFAVVRAKSIPTSIPARKNGNGEKVQGVERSA